MKAIVQDTYGSADVLELRTRPTAVADDEVLVRVRGSGVDRGMWHLYDGLPYPIRIAGVRVRAAKNRPGHDLAGSWRRRQGGDQLHPRRRGVGIGKALRGVRRRTSNKLAPKPANLTFEQAAAIAISA